MGVVLHRRIVAEWASPGTEERREGLPWACCWSVASVLLGSCFASTACVTQLLAQAFDPLVRGTFRLVVFCTFSHPISLSKIYGQSIKIVKTEYKMLFVKCVFHFGTWITIKA